MRSTLTRLATYAAAAALAISLVHADTQAPVDPASLGPQVGDKAIPFTLPDQTGAPRELRSLAGPNGTMLVFFRSSDW